MTTYKKGKYICPTCEKDCGNPPALKLHSAYCKGKTVEKKEECDHEFRLLNPKSPAEERALQEGYLQVCTKCKELE